MAVSLVSRGDDATDVSLEVVVPMRRMFRIAMAFVAMGCSPSTQPSHAMKVGEGPIEPRGVDSRAVQVWGSLRSVMLEGNTEARVSLPTVVPGPHAYAVGALSGLRGEVTILDDDVVMSFGGPGGTVRTVTGPGQEAATLLVLAVVPKWTNHSVEHAIGPDRVDEQLEAIATAAGVDTGTRFPVLIEGTAKVLEWHVLGGKAEGGGNPHHGARSTGRLSPAKVTLVGFLSRSDEGVFTHMGQHSHFHLITTTDRRTAHVDAFELEPGSVVHFPAR